MSDEGSATLFTRTVSAPSVARWRNTASTRAGGLGAAAAVVAAIVVWSAPASSRFVVACGVLALCVVFITLLAVTMSRTSSRVGRLSAAARAAARGEFIRCADGSDDVIGQLARDLDVVFDLERRLVTGVHVLSQRLEQGSDGVFRLGDAVLRAAESTASAAESAAQAAAQVSQGMQFVASAGEELAAAIHEVSGHAAHAAQMATGATGQAEDASSAVAKLGRTSERVGEIVQLIQRIARQTHLLALNATLEAGRGGDSGKGFAVVAGEVKALATETAQAVDAVQGSVGELLTGTHFVTTSIGDIARTIRTVNDNQSAIASAVEQQTASTEQIGRAAAQAADASADIASNVADLSTAIRRMAYSGAQADTKAGELSQLHQELAALIAGIDVSGLDCAVEPEASVPVAVRVGDATVVEDYVVGTGLNQIEYVGSWAHSTANAVVGGTNSYSVMPDDYALLRFEGTRVKVFMVTQHNQAIVAISVDDGEEVFADCYSPTRRRGVCVYESPKLTRGRHSVRVRVTGKKNPESSFFWTSLDWFEVS